MQPLKTVERSRVLFFLTTGLHLGLHFVAIHHTRCRRERIAASQCGGIGDRRTEYAVGADAIEIASRREPLNRVQLGNLALHVCHHGKRQVTSLTIGLRAATRAVCRSAAIVVACIGTRLIRIVDTRQQGLVAVIDHVHAGIICRNCFRTRSRNRNRISVFVVLQQVALTNRRELPDVQRKCG